jgi:hypothetical protein
MTSSEQRGPLLCVLSVGDRITFDDARGASRSLEIVAVAGGCRWAESSNAEDRSSA